MKKWEEDLVWYQQDPAPEERPFEEYITLYQETGNSRYFMDFLHYYEQQLNTKIKGMVQRFSLEGHFADLKSTYVIGLLKAADTYDPSYGNTFVQYKEYITKKEIDDYIRTMRTGYTVQSENAFRDLKKAMWLFNGSGRDGSEENLQIIAKIMGMRLKTLKEILAGGLRNENQVDFYKTNDDEDAGMTIEELIRDEHLDPEKLFFLQRRWDIVMGAFEDLTVREKNVVASRCGFCENCYGIKKEMKYKEIATNNCLSSAEAAENIYKKAVREMREKIVGQI